MFIVYLLDVVENRSAVRVCTNNLNFRQLCIRALRRFYVLFSNVH